MTRWLLLVWILVGACGAPKAQGVAAWLRFENVEVARVVGEAQQVSVPWICQGEGRVRVLGLRGSCGCARLGVLPEYVYGGQRGVLTIDLAPTDRVGWQPLEIRAYTDAPRPRDVAVVRLTGRVRRRNPRTAVISEGARGVGR